VKDWKGNTVRAETTSEKPEVRTGLFQSVSDYVKDVRVEMTKVSWPTRDELRESTLVVIVMVFIMMVFIGAVDRALSLAFEALVKLLG
jgi:preprotein translocase subunit SecE